MRGRVALAFDGTEDKKAMAELVGSRGFQAIKAMMISNALEAAAEGPKGIAGPGLAKAVDVLTMCEVYHEELTHPTGRHDEPDED